METRRKRRLTKKELRLIRFQARRAEIRTVLEIIESFPRETPERRGQRLAASIGKTFQGKRLVLPHWFLSITAVYFFPDEDPGDVVCVTAQTREGELALCLTCEWQDQRFDIQFLPIQDSFESLRATILRMLDELRAAYEPATESGEHPLAAILSSTSQQRLAS